MDIIVQQGVNSLVYAVDQYNRKYAQTASVTFTLTIQGKVEGIADHPLVFNNYSQMVSVLDAVWEYYHQRAKEQ